MIRVKNKKRFKRTLKISSAIFLSATAFFLTAFIYLKYSDEKIENTADAKDFSVPYEKDLPENKGLIFIYPDNSANFLYLDFSEKRILIQDIEIYSEDCDLGGYSVDFSFKIDYPVIAEIIDRIGGIEMKSGKDYMRFTGTQITDMLSYSTDTDALRQKIIMASLKSVSKNGLSDDDFIYIIENTDTLLTVPDYLLWKDYLEDMCMRTVSINFNT